MNSHPLLPTISKCEVYVVSFHWIFAHLGDGFRTLVGKLMAVDSSVSQHAHAADESSTVSEHRMELKDWSVMYVWELSNTYGNCGGLKAETSAPT